MSVVIECRTVLVGHGCKMKVVAADEEEALSRIAEHVRSAHGMPAEEEFQHAARQMMRQRELKSG